MQGWRISMEDAHTAVLDLEPNNKTGTGGEAPKKLSFFGVFDGHGGDKVALFAGENIHNIIMKQDSFKQANYAQSLKDGFLATDRAILNGTRNLICPLIFTSARLFYDLSLWPLFCSENRPSGSQSTLSSLANSKSLQTLNMRRKSLAAPPVLV